MPVSTLVAVKFRLAARSFAQTHVLLAGRRPLVKTGVPKSQPTIQLLTQLCCMQFSDKLPHVDESFDVGWYSEGKPASVRLAPRRHHDLILLGPIFWEKTGRFARQLERRCEMVALHEPE